MRYDVSVIRTAWLAAIGLVLASALPAQTDSAAPRPRAPKPSSTLITEDEIDRIRPSVANAFDVVQHLRPRWLRTRTQVLPPTEGGSIRMQDIHVYLNDHEMGGLNFLKSIPAEQIYTLRFMSLAEVGARYGPSSGPGIVVVLRH